MLLSQHSLVLLLQERLQDEDGPLCKAKAGEDPHNIGLSLEYVFGCFVPTAELALFSAQRSLGAQSLTLSVKPTPDLLLTPARRSDDGLGSMISLE